MGKGGEGGIELAKKVLSTLESKESHYKPIYDLNSGIKEKIEIIAREIYGAKGVTYDPAAENAIKNLEALGYKELPICMAKNQYSLSDDPSKLGRPRDFTINIRELYVSAGAGFIVAITGTIMTMPGLPKVPAAEESMWTRMVELLDFSKKEEIILVEEVKHLYPKRLYLYNKRHLYNKNNQNIRSIF